MAPASKAFSTAISSKLSEFCGSGRLPIRILQNQAGLIARLAWFFIMDSTVNPQGKISFCPVHVRTPPKFTGRKHIHFRIVEE